jgi:uncharacterized protein YkwD
MAVAVAMMLTATAGAATRHRHRHHTAARCAGAHRRIAASTASALKAAVVCLINQQRTGRGLPGLQANTDLDHSAQRWTRAMVTHHEFTHGSDFASRITAAGFHWTQAGENIATGYPTPRAVLAGWMASTDHCRNILDPSFRDIGIGEDDSPVRPFASGPATWTQDFGLRMGQSAPSHNRRPMNGCPY